MNDTKKSNGICNGFKLTTGNVKMIFGVVGIAVLCFLWLTSEFEAKADQTEVTRVEEKVSKLSGEIVKIRLTQVRMDAKLDLLLDK